MTGYISHPLVSKNPFVTQRSVLEYIFVQASKICSLRVAMWSRHEEEDSGLPEEKEPSLVS